MPSQLPLRESELLLLSMLRQKPSHAYLLAKRLPRQSQSTVYQAIRRLRVRNLLYEEVEMGIKNPDRKVLRVSDAGHQLLANHEEEWLDSLRERLTQMAGDYRRLANTLRQSGNFS